MTHEEHLSDGWSITVGELKAAMWDLPDNTEVMISNADVGDIEIGALRIEDQYPSNEIQVGLLVLEMGQIVSYEYDFDARMDQSFITPGPRWTGMKWEKR